MAALYDAHAARLYRAVIYPRLGNAAAAEDVLSETFRAALSNLGAYRETGAGFFAWLATIAKHKVLDLHRANQTQGRALCGFSALLGSLEGVASPEQILLRERDQQTLQAGVQRVLQALRPRYGRAIELRIFRDNSRAECAKALGVSVATFDVVMLRALRAFRKEWEKVGLDLGSPPPAMDSSLPSAGVTRE